MNPAVESDAERHIWLIVADPEMLTLVPGFATALRAREWRVAAWLHPRTRELLGPWLPHVLPLQSDGPAPGFPDRTVAVVLGCEDHSASPSVELPRQLDARLADLPRLTLTPHSADASRPPRSACRLTMPDPAGVDPVKWNRTLEDVEQSVTDYAEALITPADLCDQTLLVTAGPTLEDLDPVRFLTNRSSGRMGVALARAAWRHGARVRLIHGPLQVPVPVLPDLQTTAVRSAQEMHEAALGGAADANAVIMCAAVADRRPEKRWDQKIKKSDTALSQLTLIPTADILADLGARSSRPFLVGFAAETGDLAQHALEKLRRKNCDLLCANDVSAPDSGFAVDTNRVVLYYRDGRVEALPLASKHRVAEHIVRRVARELS